MEKAEKSFLAAKEIPTLKDQVRVDEQSLSVPLEGEGNFPAEGFLAQSRSEEEAGEALQQHNQAEPRVSFAVA